MSFMKYEDGLLKIDKKRLQAEKIDINNLLVKLENKTNDESALIKVNNIESAFIPLDKESFIGDGYYIAVLEHEHTDHREIEKYGFYYGKDIDVYINEKTRKDSNGVERCYLKVIAKEDVPDKRIYYIVNNHSGFRMYFGRLEKDKPTYYTFKKPESYSIQVEDLSIDDDVLKDEGDTPRYGIKIKKTKK